MSCRPASLPLHPQAPCPSRASPQPWPPPDRFAFSRTSPSRGHTVRCSLLTLASPARCLRGFSWLDAHFCLVLSNIPCSGWTMLYVSIRSPRGLLVSMPVSQEALAQRVMEPPVDPQQSPGRSRGGGAAAAGVGLLGPGSLCLRSGCLSPLCAGSSLLPRPPGACLPTHPLGFRSWSMLWLPSVAQCPRGQGTAGGIAPILMGPQAQPPVAFAGHLPAP